MQLKRKHVAAARELLDMTQQDLAMATGLSLSTIQALESGRKVARSATIEKIREAFERRGIEFYNGDEPGVRFRPSRAVIPPGL